MVGCYLRVDLDGLVSQSCFLLEITKFTYCFSFQVKEITGLTISSKL